VEGSGLFTYLFMAEFEVLSKGMRKSLLSKI